MLNDPVLLKDPIEHLEWPAAIDHVVFRNDLKPVDHRLLGEDVFVMWNPQSDTDTIIGKGIESVGRHNTLLFREKTRVGGLRDDKPPTDIGTS